MNAHIAGLMDSESSAVSSGGEVEEDGRQISSSHDNIDQLISGMVCDVASKAMQRVCGQLRNHGSLGTPVAKGKEELEEEVPTTFVLVFIQELAVVGELLCVRRDLSIEQLILRSCTAWTILTMPETNPYCVYSVESKSIQILGSNPSFNPSTLQELRSSRIFHFENVFLRL